MSKLLVVLLLHFVLANCTKETKDIKDNFYTDSHVTLIDSDWYMLNVSQQFIYELEDYGVCNTKLADIKQTIRRVNHFGFDVIGTVIYKNGFLNTFQQVTQDSSFEYIDQDKNAAYMSMELVFSSLIMYYDYFADLTEKSFSGTVAVPMNSLSISLTVNKYFDNDTITHDLHITGFHARIGEIWAFEPANHYTEIINKDINFDFASSEKNIEILWNKLLKKAIDNVPVSFPKLCLMC